MRALLMNLQTAANLKEAINLLHRSGVKNPRLDAELLLAAACGRTRLDIVAHPETALTVEQLRTFHSFIQRRTQRYPLAYLVGYREFYGLKIAVSEGVLIPRPETEILVEETIRRIGNRPAIIADIGAGSGAISVALAVNLPQSTLYAAEISPRALQVARSNVDNYELTRRVALMEGDLVEPLRELGVRFDAIVSNPPYVPSSEMPGLEPEISLWEPREALDGGPDGFDVIRRLLPDALESLEEDGFLAIEVGMGQSEAVRTLAGTAGYSRTETVKDLAGIERVVICRK